MLYAYFSKIKSIRTGIIFFVFTCLIKPNAYSQSKPNIIFILADDVGFSVPKVNGGQSYYTPFLDSMARNGMNFTHCEATPLCMTSRMMFLTGKYNFRNYSNPGYMNESAKTIANLMHDAGYVTGMFGKLQLQYEDSTMHNWGWDKHVVFELTEDTMRHSRYKNPVLIENGYRIPDSVTANKYGDDVLTQKLLNFINVNKAKPFFAYYSMSIGHSPYSPTPDDAAFATWDPKLKISDTSFFPSMMRYMDKKIGVILNRLRLWGLDKNTIVFFSGDNGIPIEIYYDANGVKHIQGEKGTTQEGGTHVPLIAYWPGHITKGSINNDLINFIDFFPTFAEVAGVKNLWKYGKLDGLSFYPALLNQTYVPKKQLFSHHDPHPGFTYLQRWVHDKTYKLYDSTGKGRSGKFYNTVNDPKEKYPLADSALTQQQKEIKQRFKTMLDTIGTWPDAPSIINPLSDSITNKSVRLTATITSQGASKLIDRGSSLSTPDLKDPYLQYKRMPDSVVKLGTFSQVRKDLFPQTLYEYSLYAMNNNKSHSTGYAIDSFYTLSNPVIAQPVSFTATVNSGIVYLSWGNAQFPSGGAKNAGYLLVYSKDSIKILSTPNGKAPAGIVVNGKIIPTVSTILPALPSVSATIQDLLPGTYQFKLIPYTWNSSRAETYNYLTKNALNTTAVIQAQFTYSNAIIIKEKNNENINVHPNPARDYLTVEINNKVEGALEFTVMDMNGKKMFSRFANDLILSNNRYQLDLTNLIQGGYTLQVRNGQNINSVKFILMKD